MLTNPPKLDPADLSDPTYNSCMGCTLAIPILITVAIALGAVIQWLGAGENLNIINVAILFPYWVVIAETLSWVQTPRFQSLSFYRKSSPRTRVFLVVFLSLAIVLPWLFLTIAKLASIAMTEAAIRFALLIPLAVIFGLWAVQLITFGLRLIRGAWDKKA